MISLKCDINRIIDLGEVLHEVMIVRTQVSRRILNELKTFINKWLKVNNDITDVVLTAT